MKRTIRININWLQNITEEKGIKLVKVSPAYSSQQCSQCGAIDEKNRLGEKFSCIACGYKNDADVNASLNILHRGVYSPSLPQPKQPIEKFQ